MKGTKNEDMFGVHALAFAWLEFCRWLEEQQTGASFTFTRIPRTAEPVRRPDGIAQIPKRD
jgi:hypothetical protein